MPNNGNRVTLYCYSVALDGKLVLLPDSMQELLEIASRKFNFEANRIYSLEGAEMDDIRLIRCGDVLRVTPVVSSQAKVDYAKKRKFSDSVENDPKGKELVKLNIGGKNFSTNRSTLLKEPMSMLAKMFDQDHGMHPSTVDDTGTYFIDRDPTYFKVILNYLRDGKLIIDNNVSPIGIRREAEFFGIESLISNWADLACKLSASGEKDRLKEQELVKLNIGGKYFSTTRTTLFREPTSMLAKMLDQDLSIQPSIFDDTGAYFIDRDPTYFEVILNYLRDGKLIIDSNVSPIGIRREAEFYGIESLISNWFDLASKHNRIVSRNDIVQAQLMALLSSKVVPIQFRYSDLTGVDLSYLYLKDIDFSFSCFRGCRMTRAVLTDCKFDKACFDNVDLSHSSFDRRNRNLTVRDTSFQGTDLTGSLFEKWTVFENVDFEGCNLKSTSLATAKFVSCNLKRVNFDQADLFRSVFEKCNLTEATFQGSELNESSFKNTILEYVNLQGAKMKHPNFKGANLNGANLQNCNLMFSYFSRGQPFDEEIDYRPCNIMERTNFEGANLAFANLSNCDLEACRLDGATLIGANLEGIIIRGDMIPILGLMTQ